MTDDTNNCPRCERLSEVLASARSQSLAHLSARLGAEGEVARLQSELGRVRAQVPDAQFTDVLLRNERLMTAEQELRRAIGLALADSGSRLSDDVRRVFIALAGPGVSP